MPFKKCFWDSGVGGVSVWLADRPPLLLGSPPISHEYYDPAEFMEGGPQEADRVDELEYEVSWPRMAACSLT